MAIQSCVMNMEYYMRYNLLTSRRDKYALTDPKFNFVLAYHVGLCVSGFKFLPSCIANYERDTHTQTDVQTHRRTGVITINA